MAARTGRSATLSQGLRYAPRARSLLHHQQGHDQANGTFPARKSLKGASADGGKSPGIDLLLGGFVTVTGHELPGAPASLRHFDPADLAWLFSDAGPQIPGCLPTIAAAPPPSAKPDPVPSPALGAKFSPSTAKPDVAASRVPGHDSPGIRFSRSRLLRFASDRALSNDMFQCLFTLWAFARRGVAGWAPVSLAVTELSRLPGAREGTRRSRLKSRLVRAELESRGLLRTVSVAIPPSANRGGVVTQREVIAPLVSTGPDDGQDIIRLPRASVLRMLGLPPRRLRLLCWAIATFGEAVKFVLPLSQAAAAARTKPERAAEHLSALAADGWLIAVQPPDAAARRPGRYVVNVTGQKNTTTNTTTNTPG